MPKLLNDLLNHPNQTKYFSILFKDIDDSLEEEKKLVYKPFIACFIEIQ
ncbi:MAG: hypothetical protein IPG08_02530 [Sphingobacteriaceae bacterium]|nr:hypothetical protein [Sphingobacteriaceae bacterium]